MEKWRTEKLEKIKNIELIMGQSPPSSSFNENSEGLPFLQGNADFGSIYPTISKYTTNPIKIALEDDILLSVRAPVGDINLAPFKLCIGRGLAAIRIKENSNIFYFYWFQKIKNILENLGIGSTFKAITKNELKRLAIPIPPLSEQQKIAEILGTVDEAIQRVDEVIEKTKRLKQGLMKELLTKGIGHKEFKDSEIGRIPKKWEATKAEEVFCLEYGEGLVRSDRDNGKFPVFGSNGIVGYHSKYLIKGPGIIVGRKGTIGAVTWSEEDFWPIDTAYYINLKYKDINLKWLYYKLISLNLPKLNMATGVPGLNREIVHLLKFAIPLKEEQQEIVERVTTFDSKIETEKKRKERLERIKKELMEELLTGKKRVKI